MNQTVVTSPLTKFRGGLPLLHEAEDDAVKWQESTAIDTSHCEVEVCMIWEFPWEWEA